MSFTAKYPAVCGALCQSDIEPGDVVEYVDEQLQHIDCDRPNPSIDYDARPVCPDCFLIHPAGACDS